MADRRQRTASGREAQPDAAAANVVNAVVDSRGRGYMEILAITEDNLEPYLSHLARHLGESGRHGLPIFHPLPASQCPGIERLRIGRDVGLARAITEPGWRRMWGAWDGNHAAGHIELAGGGLSTDLHRATLMLGLEMAYYGKGLATRLVDTAFAWAHSHKQLQRIHLEVFAHNTPGIKLYKRLGFEVVGKLEDRYRVEGKTIDVIIMALAIND